MRFSNRCAPIQITTAEMWISVIIHTSNDNCTIFVVPFLLDSLKLSSQGNQSLLLTGRSEPSRKIPGLTHGSTIMSTTAGPFPLKASVSTESSSSSFSTL